MAQILIRNVPEATAAALRARAERNGTSLQAEALVALEQSIEPNGTRLSRHLLEMHKRRGQKFPKSAADAAVAALIEDRESR